MGSTNLRDLFVRATEIAWEKHAGVKDKAGAPYIGHPMRVAERCKNDAERIVAVLHDTLEDTDLTTDDLRKEGFPEDLIEALESVTRRDKSEPYDDFIRRAAKNPIGRQVKIHDLEDNMDVTRFTRDLTTKDLDRLNKYIRSYHYLTSME